MLVARLVAEAVFVLVVVRRIVVAAVVLAVILAAVMAGVVAPGSAPRGVVVRLGRVVAALRDEGLGELASSYESYYRNAWDDFMADHTGDSAAAAIEAGATALLAGSRFAQQSG